VAPRRNMLRMSKVKHMTLEKVNSFVFLGTLITADDNASDEMNNRITLASKSFFLGW
jgi:hypothetical protein